MSGGASDRMGGPCELKIERRIRRGIWLQARCAGRGLSSGVCVSWWIRREIPLKKTKMKSTERPEQELEMGLPQREAEM